MRHKFYCPISGIPRGTARQNAPYRNAGKYHHRRDLLFTVQWGRALEQKVSRAKIPLGSTLVWQKDVGKVWPLKDCAANENLYRQNEIRYLTPALKAHDLPIRDYLMRQLDPHGRSGIGFFNVKWRYPAIRSRSSEDPLSEEDIDRLPDDIPKHLAALVHDNHPDVLIQLLNHSIPRQKIPILDHLVKKSQEFSFTSSHTSKTVNPYPVAAENQSLIKSVKAFHILRLNPRYRPADKKKPIWRHRNYYERQRKKSYCMRKSIIEQEEKLRFIRTAKRHRMAALES